MGDDAAKHVRERATQRGAHRPPQPLLAGRALQRHCRAVLHRGEHTIQLLLPSFNC